MMRFDPRSTGSLARRGAMVGWRGRLAMVLAAGALLLGPACVQAQEQEDRQTPEQMMATQLMLMSLRQMQGIHSPGPGQMQAAAMLLDEAARLDPDDPQLWRHIASLEDQRGDQEAWAAAIRRYLKLNPTDEAAFYDLLIHRASQEQTLDARSAYVQRVLTQSPAGALSNPLQSRLASYLAVAAREQGDTAMMLHWLKQAVILDTTNVTAASMMYQLLVENDAEEEKRIRGLFRLLEAAPADPLVRLQMADACFSQGLYRRAAQQYDMAAQLSGGTLEPKMFEPWITSLLATAQPRAALRLLYDLEDMIRDASPEADPLTAWPGEDDGAQAVSLPVSTLVLWLMASPHDDMPNAERRVWTRLLEAEKQGDSATSDAGSLPQGLVWLAALYSPDVAGVQQLIDSMPDGSVDRQLAQGFLAYREGDREAAAAVFNPLFDRQVLAQYGAALLIDDREARSTALQKIAREQPGTIVGAMAAARVSEANELPNASLLGVRIEQMVRGVSRRLWFTDLQQDPWVVLRVNMDQGRYGYLQPMVCEIRLSNNARAPLAVGPGRGMPAGGVLTTTATVNGRQIGRVPPIVFDLMDQLRVESDRPLRHTVRLDRSILGLLLANQPELSFNLRITCIVAPQVLDNRAVVPGPTGVARRIHSLFRIGLNGTPQLLDRWTRQVEDLTNPQARLRAIARLARTQPIQQPRTNRQVQSIGQMIVVEDEQGTRAERRLTEEQQMLLDLQLKAIETIRTRYPQMDELSQAWTVRFIAPIDEAGQDGQPPAESPYADILQQASQSDRPLVRMMYLANHVSDPADPSLVSAVDSGNQTIADFAAAVQDAITERAEREAALQQRRREQDARQQTQDAPTDDADETTPTPGAFEITDPGAPNP